MQQPLHLFHTSRYDHTVVEVLQRRRAAVHRFDTVTQSAGLQFSLGTGYGPNYADDLAVLPGHPESVALSLYDKGISLNGVGVFIYLAEGRGNVFVNRVFLTQLRHQDPTVTVSAMQWTPFAVRFRATSAMTSWTMSDATGTPFPGGLVLDDLAVTPASSAGAPAAGSGEPRGSSHPKR